MNSKEQTAQRRLQFLPAPLSLLLFHIAPIIPPLGLFAMAPLYYAFVVHGVTVGAISTAVVTILTVTIGGMAQAGLYLAVCGVGAYFLSEGFIKGRPAPMAILISAAASLVGIGVLLFIIASQNNMGVTETLVNWANNSVDTILQSYEKADIEKETQALLTENRDPIVATLVAILPSLALVSLLFTTLANVFAIRIVSQKFRLNFHFDYSFARFSLPDETVWALIAGAVIGVLVEGVASDFALNIFVICIAVYIIQGAAIIHYFFVERKVSVLLRAIGFFMVFSQPLFMSAVAGLGLFDTWADFRKLNYKKSAPDDNDGADNL